MCWRARAFSDQLRRFLAAREAFRKALGAQAPRDFIVGTQHSLDKVPRNKYWFKGDYGVSVSMDAARNECESVQIAVLPDIGQRLTGATLSAGDLRSEQGGVISAAHFTIYRVGYVETQPARYPTRRPVIGNPLRRCSHPCRPPTVLDRPHAGKMSSPGVEPGLRPSHGRVLNPPHSEDSISVPRRGIEPRPAVPKTAVLSGTPAGHIQSVSRPGLEPGPGPSEGPMRSATPSGQLEG